MENSTFETFEMVLASFQVEDKLKIVRFFLKTFFLADTSAKIVPGMPYLTFSNTDVLFSDRKLTWRSYTTAKPLPITKQVELINKKEFAKAALDKNVEAFVLHMTLLSLSSIFIHPAREV